MFNQPRFKYVLLLGDIASLTAAFAIALLLAAPEFAFSSLSSPTRLLRVILSIGFSLPVYLFVFFVNNLYKRQTFRLRYRHIMVILKCLLVSTVVMLPAVFVFWWDFFTSWGRIFIPCFLITALLLCTFGRLSIVKYLINPIARGLGRRRILLVGGDSAVRTVMDSLSRDRHSPFVVVGIVDDYKDKGQQVLKGWENLGRLEDLGSIIRSHKPEEILIAVDSAPYGRLVQIVDACLATGLVVRVFSDRLRILAERLGAELYAEGIPVVMLSQVQPGAVDRTVRRFIDVILSAVTLIVLSPLLLIVVVGIKLSSTGPIIFRQTRIGLAGRPFGFYKFRSMHVGNSEGCHRDFVQKFIKGENPDGAGKQELQVFKIKDDPRIFPFGRLIRRTSLDELPQLVNVLKGEMGLIGPRPCLPYEWEAYDEWHKDRLKVVPGCTGLWQVLGRSTVSFEDMVLMDLYYISNYSLHQDARILYKTIPAIFFAKGGY